MVKGWTTAVVVAALCWSHASLAQDQEAAAPGAPGCEAPSLEDVEAAKQAFRDGQLAFSEGDYPQAAKLWQWAYERDCSAHALLLNLATAQELLGRPDLAEATLRQFNERAPGSPYLEANRKRIARLERVALAPIRPRREATTPCAPAPAPAPALAEPADGGIPWPWIVAGGGALATVVGGIFYVEARYSAGQVSDVCGGADGCSRVENVLEGERARARAQTAGWVTGVGLAALAGGVVWQLTTPSASLSAAAARPLQLHTRTAASGLEVMLSGGF